MAHDASSVVWLWSIHPGPLCIPSFVLSHRKVLIRFPIGTCSVLWLDRLWSCLTCFLMESTKRCDLLLLFEAEMNQSRTTPGLNGDEDPMDHWFQVWIYWACGGHAWHCYSISAVQCTIHWPGRKTNGISDWRQMTLEQLSPIDWVCKAIYVITAMHQAPRVYCNVPHRFAPEHRRHTPSARIQAKKSLPFLLVNIEYAHWCPLIMNHRSIDRQWLLLSGGRVQTRINVWPFSIILATSCVHAQCTRNEAIWPRFDCIKSCLIIIIVIIVVVQLSWVALRFFSFSQLFELLRAHDPISLVRAFARVRSWERLRAQGNHHPKPIPIGRFDLFPNGQK